MGEAPKIIEELKLTRAQLRENERQWSLDPTTGQLEPEDDPSEDPQVQPEPIRIARQTFD